MKKYIEFCDIEKDGYVSAADALNKFIAENESLKVSVIFTFSIVLFICFPPL